MKHNDEHQFDDKLERLDHSVHWNETRRKELGQRIMVSLDKRPKRNMLLTTVKYTANLAAIILFCLIGYQVAQHFLLQEDVAPTPPPKTVIDDRPEFTENRLDLARAGQVADVISERNDLKLAEDIATISANYSKNDFSLSLLDIEENGIFNYDVSLHETLYSLLIHVEKQEYPDSVLSYFDSIYENYAPNELVSNQDAIEAIYVMYENLNERGLYVKDRNETVDPEVVNEEEPQVEEEPIQEQPVEEEPTDKITINNNRVLDPEFLSFAAKGQIEGIDVIIDETTLTEVYEQWGEPDDQYYDAGVDLLVYNQCHCAVAVDAFHDEFPEQYPADELKVTGLTLNVEIPRQDLIDAFGTPVSEGISDMDISYIMQFQVGEYQLRFENFQGETLLKHFTLIKKPASP